MPRIEAAPSAAASATSVGRGHHDRAFGVTPVTLGAGRGVVVSVRTYATRGSLGVDPGPGAGDTYHRWINR
ncbi:hypothetical protein GCM10023199_15810 [Actinomycetospora chibensis]